MIAVTISGVKCFDRFCFDRFTSGSAFKVQGSGFERGIPNLNPEPL